MTNPAIHMKTLDNVNIQIATPQCIGVGFVFPSFDLIVTNFHIVEGHPQVIVHTKNKKRFLADVLYIDEMYDIAFIELPKDLIVEQLSFSTNYSPKEPIFIREKTIKTGKILDPCPVFDNIEFIATNLPMDTAYCGSPLMNDKGQIIGINTSNIYENDATGFALPISHVMKSMEEYQATKHRIATRCLECKLVASPDSEFSHCNGCTSSKLFPSDYPVYEAEGISRTIENLIKAIGHQPNLSRKGSNHWALVKGSATIYLSYYEPSGYILGDAFLCSLPKERKAVENIYQFLLQQNYLIKGLTFSIQENDIVLSLIIYDRHLNTNTALELLQTLLERADYYDNILVEQYGAIWKN
jgi:serine protease Do